MEVEGLGLPGGYSPHRLFGVIPVWIFALVLAFSHERNTFQFLVFCRGGLFASDECDITSDGRLKVARLFLAQWLCSTAEEAGIVAYNVDATFLLLEDQRGTGPPGF